MWISITAPDHINMIIFKEAERMSNSVLTLEDLEKKIFYRLIKVIYFFLLINFMALIIFAGYLSIPKNVVDNEKSYIKCEDGRGYYLSYLGFYIYGDDDSLGYFDNEKAKKICYYSNVEPRVLLRDLSQYPDTPPSNYIVSVKYKKDREWFEPFLIWGFGTIICYTILNIFREVFVYIAYGRKLTWDWILKFIRIN